MPGRQTLAFVALLASVGVPYASSNSQAILANLSDLVRGPKAAAPATAAMPSVVSKPSAASTPSVAASQTTPRQTVAQPVVWPSWGKKSTSDDSSDSDSGSGYNKSRSSSSDNNYSNSRGSGSQGNYSSSGSSGSDYSSGNSSSGNYSGSKNYGSKSGTNNSGSYNSGSYNSGSYNSGSYNSGSSNSNSGSGSSYGSSSYGNNDYSSSRSSNDDDDSSSGGYNEYKSSGSNYSSGSGSDYSSKPSYGSGYSSSGSSNGYGSSNNYGSSSSSYNNRGSYGSGNSSSSSSYWGSSGNYSSSSDRDSYSRDRRRRTPLEDTDFGAPKPGDPPKYDPRELTDVFQFSVTPEWIFERWPRVSTGLSQLDLHGYRVPLITGTAEHDLAGSLTYYFDKSQQLDRIMFKGTTGDPEKLVRLLTTYYGFSRQKTTDPGLHLYQVKRSGKTISELRIKPSKVVRADSPRSRYQIDMVIARR